MEQSWIMLLAIAPGPALGALVWWLDRYNREPHDLLIGCFLWGAASIVPVIVLQHTLVIIVQPDMNNLTSVILYAFGIIAATEELTKYLVVRSYVYWRPDFDEPYDGITYTVMVAMGFATTENILYVVGSDASMQLGIALLRMFTAVPAHAANGVLMGYFLGLAKFTDTSRGLHIAACAAAIIAHGLYDVFLLYSNPGALTLGAFVVLAIAVRLSIRAIRIHQHISPFRDQHH
ncbi:MAG: PrsW family glutamic-type intramembrane protease [Chlorobi bacterium]|nr:PrsW family glutamic-type intramembrane protease [Chlorobiota bacterium]